MIKIALELIIRSTIPKKGFVSVIDRKIRVGRKCIELALQLYYAYQSPETPRWAKNIIRGALGYFIFPLGVIPDFLPGGHVDDYAVILLAVAMVAKYITDEMKDKAKCKSDELFGEEEKDGKGE